jgi:hypothetical protein
LLRKLVKSCGATLSLALGDFAPAQAAGQMPHSQGNGDKHYEHNPIVEFLDIEGEVRWYKKKIPQASACCRCR